MSPPPPPVPVADTLAIRPKPAQVQNAAANGRSSLVIQRSVGGLDGSGLSIGR